MNQLTIIGNLVRDPETGTTEGGVNWCRFTVAARKKRVKEGEPDAEFVRVTAWRGLGDTCAKYLRKGRKVCIIGEPTVHAWIGQDGNAKGAIDMNADSVEFLIPGSGQNDAPTDADAPPERGAAPVDQESGMAQVEAPADQPW
jgi:single-strand DNA-binding protein